MSELFTGHGYALLGALRRRDQAVHSLVHAIFAGESVMVAGMHEHRILVDLGLIEPAGRAPNKSGVEVDMFRVTEKGWREVEKGHPGTGRPVDAEARPSGAESSPPNPDRRSPNPKASHDL